MDEIARASVKPFPVAHSLLLADALTAEVTQGYAIGQTVDCTLFRSYANDVYIVSAGEDDYFLKVYRFDWRSATEIAYEVDLFRHLYVKGARVAPVIPRRNGEVIGTLQAPEGPRHYVLFRAAEGAKPRAPFDTDLYHAFGRATAGIHQASDDFTSPHQRVPLDLQYWIDRPMEAILPRLAHRPDDQSYLTYLAEKVRAKLLSLAAAGLDWGPCHGDVTLDNVQVTADNDITFYDFDSGGPGWRASDPYGVFQYAALDGNGFWDAFLAGYTEARPFGSVDVAAVPYFVVAQEIWGLGLEARYWTRWSGLWRLNDGFLDRTFTALRRWEIEQLGRD